MKMSYCLNPSMLATAAATLAAVLVFGGQAQAVNDLIAGWTFEEGPPFHTPDDVTDSATGPTAFAGTGAQTNIATMFGMHASAATDWSTPVGNGSGNSYSSTNWAVGDYYQFQTTSSGVSDIGFQFDQVSSNSGPRDFKVEYSTDGTTFTDFASYMVDPSNTPSWSSVGPSAPAGIDTYLFDLRSITAINNATDLYFRLTVTSTANAANPSTSFSANGTDRIDNISIYSAYDPSQAPVPQPPPTPLLPVAGNIAFGLNSPRERNTLELLQGTAVVNGGSKTTPYSAWTSTPFIQSVKFDNLGTAHNVQGNLLGVDTGSSGGTGTIYSFATQGSVPTPAGQVIGTTTGIGESAVDTTRLAGLSVSPNNSKVAVTGLDTGTVIVYDYTPGNTMGSGAALANGRQTAVDTLPHAGQGTAWLNDSTVLAFSTTGNLYEVDSTSMAATLKQTVATGTNTTEGTALAYNPAVSPYVFGLYGGFTNPASQSTLYIFDPTSSYNVINTVDLSGNSNTVRDLALDAAGNLFIGRNAASISVIVGAAANAATLTANPDVAWYQSDVFGSGFNGLDIGFAPPAGLPGDWNGDGKVNAADYVTWRNDPANNGGPGGYDIWRANFGNPPGSGAGLDGGAVPEPASIVLVLIGFAGLGLRRRR